MNLENLLAIAGSSSNSIPSGLIGALIGQFMPLSRSEREQNAFNQRMAEDAYNRQIQFYENFQSPQAMVEQYRQAGINPALVSGYSPSTPPSSAAASGSGGSPALGLIQLAMEMKMRNKELDIQRDLADAEIENKHANTNMMKSQTTRIDIGNKFAEAVESSNLDAIQESINLTKKKIDEAQSTIDLNGIIMEKEEAQAYLGWLDVVFQSMTLESRKKLSYWTAESVEADAKFKQARADRAADYCQKEISLMAAQAFFDAKSGQEIAAKLEQFYSRAYDSEGNIIGLSTFERLNEKQIKQLQEVTENAKKLGSLYDAQEHYYEILSEVTDPTTARHWAGELVNIADAIGKFYVAYSIGGKNIEMTRTMKQPRTVVKGFRGYSPAGGQR